MGLAEKIALIGSESLLGREIQDVLGATALAQDIKLFAADPEEAGKIASIGGEASVVSKFDPDALESAEAIILAGPVELSQRVIDSRPSGVIIDLTYAAEDDPAARVRAPLVEGPEYEGDLDAPQIVAHPAAVAITMVLARLHEIHPIERSIVHIFEPASERGAAGIEELQEQTVNLLSFQQLPKKVFGTQLSFSMLAQLGEDSTVKLADVEERIERHLATLLERAGGLPMPSLRLIQAPVFHGYSLSWWIEFVDSLTAEEIEDALREDAIEVRAADLEPPNNVAVAGQSGVSVGAITPDRNNGNAFWMWMAVDNLRLSAENAAMVAQEIA